MCDRTQREFTRMGETRAGGQHGLNDTLQNQRASMSTDLNSIFAGIAVGGSEESDNDFIERITVGLNPLSDNCHAMFQWGIFRMVPEKPLGNRDCFGAGYPHDTDTATSNRRRD